MPLRDPNAIQLDFPLLTADLIAQLNLIGTVGLLNFDPVVRPVFIVGDRDLSVTSQPVLFAQSEVFDGTAINPLAAAVIVDTGQLPAGDYDVQLHLSAALVTGGPRGLITEHRNAANDTTLTRWFCFAANTSSNALQAVFAFVLAENERFRVITSAGLTGAEVGATIMIARRTTP